MKGVYKAIEGGWRHLPDLKKINGKGWVKNYIVIGLFVVNIIIYNVD